MLQFIWFNQFTS